MCSKFEPISWVPISSSHHQHNKKGQCAHFKSAYFTIFILYKHTCSIHYKVKYLLWIRLAKRAVEKTIMLLMNWFYVKLRVNPWLQLVQIRRSIVASPFSRYTFFFQSSNNAHLKDSFKCGSKNQGQITRGNRDRFAQNKFLTSQNIYQSEK